MLNLASLNQRVNALTAKINNIVPGGENLANTLLNGNSAGASDIDMNSQDILDVNNIDLVTINSLPYPPTSAIPTFQQVLTAGNNATLPVVNFGINNLLTFVSTNVFASGIDVEFDDGITNQLTSYSYNGTGSNGNYALFSTGGTIDITTPFDTYMNTASPSTGDGTLYVQNILMEGVDNATSVLQTHSANQTSNTGYARLELDSGNIDGVVPPRAILQAFSDATQSPPYPANVNKIDLGGANGDEVLITCGNAGETLPESYVKLFTDANAGTNNYVKLGISDPVTGIGGEISFQSTAYSMTLQNQLVQTVSSLGDIVNRRNLSFGTGYTSLQCGIIEKTAINAVTSGTTTLTTANAFQTTLNTPLAAGRIFVLPAPSGGTVGYWYGICNKSTVNTIAIQYPAATTIATIAVSPSATNGGTVARFAVDYTGTTYSRIG